MSNERRLTVPTDEQRIDDAFVKWIAHAASDNSPYGYLPHFDEDSFTAGFRSRDVEVQALRGALHQIAESPADEPMWHIRAIARAALAGEEGTPS